MDPCRYELLFVYGTLRNCIGHPMHERLALVAEPLGPATTCGRLYDIGDFPALVRSDIPADIVQGEVYKLKHPFSNLLRQLDNYEGYSARAPRASLFLRQIIAVHLLAVAGSFRSVNAWCYLYNRPLGRRQRIASGDYCAYRLAERSHASSRVT